MPDEESKSPLTKIASILKKYKGQNNEADGGEGENKAEAKCEEEKIKEIIRRKVVRH
jgi:hypothetical protein